MKSTDQNTAVSVRYTCLALKQKSNVHAALRTYKFLICAFLAVLMNDLKHNELLL